MDAEDIAKDMFASHWFEGNNCICGYWAEFDSVKRHHLEDMLAPLVEQAKREAIERVLSAAHATPTTTDTTTEGDQA